MTSELTTLLDHIGYAPRPQQVALYEHLITLDHDGVIAQAGTGVGKSIAILAAAAHLREKFDRQVLVVTPTRVLTDQYMASDAPATGDCFGLDVRELRGKRWYYCARTEQSTGADMGCEGRDVDCTEKEWTAKGYRCDYQEAKLAARSADIVVTNSDMLIVNDRLLPDPIFDREGPLLIDEGHQFEPKLRDYADRSVRSDRLTRQGPPGRRLATWIERFKNNAMPVADQKQLPELIKDILDDYEEEVTLSVQQRQTKESLEKIYGRLLAPTDKAMIWTDGEALKLSWLDVSGTARELLQARPFALVSATIPSSMPSALGLQNARIIDVGHPFDYRKQATVGVSAVNGAYKYATHPDNIRKRAEEIEREVLAAGGGALLLFSSFKDLEKVYEYTFGAFKRAGLHILKQDGMRDNRELGEEFKAHGNAVLFGSESFATGFDAPGDALRLTSIFKLPYPGKDPVTEALMRNYYPRYKDQMLTRVVQAAGRLIRTVDDTGRLFIADARAEAVLQDNSLMCRHLREFKREDNRG
jgi:Rad3-related DNA helicase